MVTNVTKHMFKKQAMAIAVILAILCTCIPLGVFAAGGSVQKPEAFVPPGMYRQAQAVALTAEDGAEIYYTTNNLMPTEQDTRYTEPISVSKDTNICAIAIKDGVKSAPVTFGYFIRSAEETPQMQFVVMSDIHIGDGLQVAGGGANVYDLDKARTFKAMEVMSGIFPNPDLLVMNGDLIKHNDTKNSDGTYKFPSKMDDHPTFIKLMKDAMQAYGMENTPVQVTIGNHDSQNHSVSGMKAYYDQDEVAKDWFPDSNGYYHKEVNGLDFIYLNSNETSTEQKAFLTGKLADIQAAKGASSPIFVFLHIPINGAQDDSQWTCSADWRTILANYPQAIVFSGHTHYSITEDSSISQEAGFTAVNGGCMSYIERIDNAREMMWNSTDGTLKQIYQFPSTQCLAVEVYADRVEINRVTVNADRGDVKVNDYVPVEPFDNCGAVAGDTWVIARGDTTEAWKAGFQYTKAQRRANAQTPQFAESAKPVLHGEGRSATVTFPQAENAQKVDKYQIELVNQGTGRTEKSMKVWSENLVSPMPESLTYQIDGLAAGATYRAQVTAYNDYGVASAPIVSEETFATDELPGRKPDMMADEDFTNKLTAADETTHAVPYIKTWKDGIGRAEYIDGRVVFVGGDTTTNAEMWIPFQAKSETDFRPITEEFFVEYEYQMLSGMSDGASYLNGMGGNVMRIMFYTDGRAVFEYHNGKSSDYWSTYATKTVDFKKQPLKIRMRLGTENGKQYISGLWYNGNPVSTQKTFAAGNNSEKGWKQIHFGRNESSTNQNGSQYCAVDNFKVWRPAAAQINALVSAGEDDIAFGQIKGGNASAENVTEDLQLQDLVGTQTTNGLVILGWESDNTSVIAADGTVTRPAFAGNTATVRVTPILGMVDTMKETGEEYVRAAGTPITLTVPDLGMEPLEIAQTGYIANEDFSQELTDADHANTVIPYVDNYKSGVMGEGTMEFSTGENGAAKWVSNNLGGTNLMIPFQPGTTISETDGKKNPPPILGEFTIAFDITRLSAVAGQDLEMLLRNGAGTNIGKLTVGSTAVKLEYYSNGKWIAYASGNVSGDTHTIQVRLGTDGTTQYLGGLWIGRDEITTKKQMIAGYPSDTGWKVIATQPKDRWVTGDMCSVDNIKVWRSAEDQAKELAAADAGKITFAQIKGQNDTAEAVTEDLQLAYGEAGALQTENKLLVMGWKSNNPAVISTDGKVTRPAESDVTVTLTPVLAIQSSETGAYTTVDGTPISVTVKAQRQQQQSGFFDADSNLVGNLDASIVQGKMDISGLSGTVAAYAALYYNEQLEQVWVGQPVAAGAEGAAATVAVELPSALTGRNLKLFVWDTQTMKPGYRIPIEVK